jgi:CspA family cold shock protein
MKNKMSKGTVKFFNETKGFGFIQSENGGDVFVHVSGLKEEIKENDLVEFDVEEGKKGPTAVNVRVVE